MTFKILTGRFPIQAADFFQLNQDTRFRGHSLKLKKENFKTTVRQNFLSKRVFQIQNNLPKQVINAQSTNIFKN